MEKIECFGSFLTDVDSQKLSKTERGKQIPALFKPLKGSANTCSPLQDNNNKNTDTRCSLGISSKIPRLFERGLRKSSSLTNGIDSAKHCSDMDAGGIQESMPKKARGLAHNSDVNITSTSFILNNSGEQLTIS